VKLSSLVASLRSTWPSSYPFTTSTLTPRNFHPTFYPLMALSNKSSPTTVGVNLLPNRRNYPHQTPRMRLPNSACSFNSPLQRHKQSHRLRQIQPRTSCRRWKCTRLSALRAGCLTPYCDRVIGAEGVFAAVHHRRHPYLASGGAVAAFCSGLSCVTSVPSPTAPFDTGVCERCVFGSSIVRIDMVTLLRSMP
jgi:hypothetical protein